MTIHYKWDRNQIAHCQRALRRPGASATRQTESHLQVALSLGPAALEGLSRVRPYGKAVHGDEALFRQGRGAVRLRISVGITALQDDGG